ncbi:hypothetical protein QAD02_009107 [Eretmocerus hayati]|uniref:Uncharacterized protein n=1 Tax=Eretmocerus hayati TaxID=131215 RepID=A0ACC2NAU1_9HYME|nr:hypothetical protein QAD02_009107 [Eretmocerus hayati]
MLSKFIAPATFLTFFTLLFSIEKCHNFKFDDDEIEISNTVERKWNESTHIHTMEIEENMAWFITCDLTYTTYDSEASTWPANCILHFRNYSTQDSSLTQKKDCPFVMEASNLWPSILFKTLRAVRFVEDKFIVQWISKKLYNPSSANAKKTGSKIDTVMKFIKFLIIDITTCQLRQFETEVVPISFKNYIMWYANANTNLYYHDIHLGKDRIDIFYFKDKFNVVQESFNSTGSRIYGPASRENFIIDEDSEIIVEYETTSREREGKWLLDSRECFEVGKVCARQVPCKTRNFKTVLGHAFSSTGHKESSCYKSSKSIWMCNMKSDYSVTKNFPLRFQDDPQYIVIYNDVLNEGLLVMYSQQLYDFKVPKRSKLYGKDRKKLDKLNPYVFYLTVFDLMAQRYEPVVFADFSYRLVKPMVQLYLNYDRKICVHMAWVRDNDYFNSLIKCFPKHFLTVRSKILER